MELCTPVLLRAGPRRTCFHIIGDSQSDLPGYQGCPCAGALALLSVYPAALYPTLPYPTPAHAQACYEVRGVAERMWPPLTERAKDYIAAPKLNGYQSLHVTLRVPSVTVELDSRGGDGALELHTAELRSSSYAASSFDDQPPAFGGSRGSGRTRRRGRGTVGGMPSLDVPEAVGAGCATDRTSVELQIRTRSASQHRLIDYTDLEPTCVFSWRWLTEIE